MVGQMVCCLSWLGTVSELFEGLLDTGYRRMQDNTKVYIKCVNDDKRSVGIESD